MIKPIFMKYLYAVAYFLNPTGIVKLAKHTTKVMKLKQLRLDLMDFYGIFLLGDQ